MNKSANKKRCRPQAQGSGKVLITGSKAKLLELAHDLGERVKELNCLYSISRLRENGNASVNDILQGVVNIIPPAWQYPEVTCARIMLKNKEFKTTNFRETDWKQTENILVNEKQFGTLEVYYLEEKQPCDEGPFLKEERNLLHVIAERLGHIIEHTIAEENLQSMYRRERELREKLQSEMQVRVDFTRKLIHELKTPLTSLIATSQLLYDETRSTKLRKLARYISDGADNLNSRIEELHDVTRGEIGKLRLTLKQVNIKQLLRSLGEETRAFSQQYDISMEFKIDDSLPEVNADSDRIRQIMLNLINNACKYAKEGKRIKIRATKEPEAILIEVKDFGPGISIERQSTIFEPGYQLSYHDERSGGLGIGLALCKMLVELHGGQIWVKSETGKGTSFFFTIPVKE